MSADDLQAEPPTAQTALVEAALGYAARGWAIIPTRINKAPYTRNGVKDASKDPEQIKRWWKQWPNAGIGLACGAISGVWALDIDPGKGGDLSLEALEAEHGRLPNTLWTKTGGGGRHLLFRVPNGVKIRNSVSTIGAGLDCRGDGGYIILPPSRHESGGCYEMTADDMLVPELASDWLERLAISGPSVSDGSAASDQALPTGVRNRASYVKAALAAAATEIKNAPPGTSNDLLNRKAFSFQRFVNAGWVRRAVVEDALFQAADARGTNPATVIRKTIASGLGASCEPVADCSSAGIEADGIEADGTDDDAPPPIELSHDALALEFAAENEARLRHCAIGDGWLIFDGTRWKKDEKLSCLSRARDLARARASDVDDAKVRRSMCSANSVHAIASLARSDRRLAATVDQFDADPLLLNTTAGVVDLRTGLLRPVQSSDYFRKVTNVAPRGTCPRWERFQLEVMGGDAEMVSFLKRLAGYALTGQTSEQKLFFFFGHGANGKSTWLETLGSVFGDYAHASPMETFTESNSERHPTEIAALAGARLVYASETEQGKRWAESRIKNLTGGDTITARRMRQDYFSFTPQLKLVIAGNHRPSLQSVDVAMRRRLVLIPFEQDFRNRADPHLRATLAAERNGILSWAIEGCLEWQRDGLQIPMSISRSSEAYFESQDGFGQFLADCIEPDPQGHARAGDLWSAWQIWAERNGEPIGSQRGFGDRLEARGFPRGKRGSQRDRVHERLRLRPPDEQSG